MATSLPPFPTNSQPGSFVWVDWFKKLEGFIIDVTNVSDSGTLDPGSIVIGGGVLGSATGYFQRIGNQVTYTLELTLDGDVAGTVTFDLGTEFPRAQYEDTVTHTQASGGNNGVGHMDTNANKTVSLFNISVTGGTGSDPIIVSGRYFSV